MSERIYSKTQHNNGYIPAMPQRQAPLHASALFSRKQANAVVALLAAIGSGNVGKTWSTAGWQECRPAKVSLATMRT